jgi:hypothetical protein
MEDHSAEELFLQWGRHRSEFLAWKKITLRRQKHEKRLALKKLGWQEEVKSLLSEVDLAKEYLAKKYGKEARAAALDSADWNRDYLWEAIWEGEEGNPIKTRIKAKKSTNRDSAQTKEGRISAKPVAQCNRGVSNEIPKRANFAPQTAPETVTNLNPMVLTTKELAKKLPSTVDTLKRQATHASNRGPLPQPLESFPDWFVVEKSDPGGGRGRGWKFQAQQKYEDALNT